MKRLFTGLYILVASVGAWGQGLNALTENNSADKAVPISFSTLRQMKKAGGLVFSSVYLSSSDTALVNLYLYQKALLCLRGNASIHALDTCRFFACRITDTLFTNQQFNAPVLFNWSRIDPSCTFDEAVFNNEAVFSSTIFEGDDVFSRTRFSNKAYFVGAVFETRQQFRGTYFGDEVSFVRACFGDALDFREVTFTKPPVFLDAQLPDRLAFNGIRFLYPLTSDVSSKIDFRRARTDSLRNRRAPLINWKEKCRIMIDGTDAGRFLLPHDRFYLEFGEWATYDERMSTYETIIKTCQEAGMIESVEGWDIEYRAFQNDYKFGRFGEYINFFNEWWWNFGYDRWRILVIWLPFFFLCFLTYNYFRLPQLWNRMYKDPELGKVFRKARASIQVPEEHGSKRFAFAFFYTAVIYFGFKIRHEGVNYDYTRGLLYLYFMYAVGTLHMAFALSYILSAY